MNAESTTPRSLTPHEPPLLALRLTDPHDLSRSYLPFFRDGAVFIVTDLALPLGAAVRLLLQLPDSPYPAEHTVRVVWVSPAGLGNGAPQGLGLGFDPEEGRDLKRRIIHALDGFDADHPPPIF